MRQGAQHAAFEWVWCLLAVDEQQAPHTIPKLHVQVGQHRMLLVDEWHSFFGGTGDMKHVRFSPCADLTKVAKFPKHIESHTRRLLSRPPPTQENIDLHPLVEFLVQYVEDDEFRAFHESKDQKRIFKIGL